MKPLRKGRSRPAFPLVSKGVRVKKPDRVGYVLILPFYVFLLFFILVPILANIVLSFTNYDLLKMDFVGVKNYTYLFQDDHFLISLKNTFVYAFFTLLLSMSLGLGTALLLKDRVPGIRFYRICFYIPYITSMVAVSMIWLWIYDPLHGILNQVLGAFNIKGRQWLYDAEYALGCIIVMSIWKVIGYNLIVYLAGLQGIPRYLYEAATMDGANYLEKFLKITLPMLRPVTFFLFVTGFINSFKVFEQVMILTAGGPSNSTTTVVHQIYNRAFTEFSMGYAASLSIFLLFIIAVVTFFNYRYGNQGQDLDIG
jgi:multiple sugar transport system permease protein/raffinose/stachyose/melibiose transport system permease protein